MSDTSSSTSAESLVEGSYEYGEEDEESLPPPEHFLYNNSPPHDDALAVLTASAVQDNLVKYLSLPDISSLWSTNTTFNSVGLLGDDETDPDGTVADGSPIARAQQFSPLSLVKQFLGLIRRDFGEHQETRHLWELEDWVGGTFDQIFDLSVQLPLRDQQLLQLFTCTFSYTPSTCFKLYLSLLRSDIVVSEPKHILWLFLKLNRGLFHNWDDVRMTGFMMDTEIALFNNVTSSLLDEVATCFDEMFRDREYCINEAFLPYSAEKYVFYLSNSRGYDCEITTLIPDLGFPNLIRENRSPDPGYILQISVRRNQTEFPSFFDRHLDFYRNSLRESREDEELIVMAGDAEGYEDDDDTILANGIIRLTGGSPYPVDSLQLIEALERAELCAEDVESSVRLHFSHHIWAELWNATDGENETNLLKQLKFVAYMHNLELSLDA